MQRTSDPQPLPSAFALRRELSARNLVRCAAHVHEVSYSAVPSVLYAEDAVGRHGNFYPPAYRRILANPQWCERLTKAYSASNRIPYRYARTRRELDTATSSDALLMSIFCAPGVLQSERLKLLLSIDSKPRINFGVRTHLPLRNDCDDRTEADLEIVGANTHLLVEAKLTETNFQTARPTLLNRYAGFEHIFDTDHLPRNGRNEYVGYQLIRLILAAHHHDARFALLTDARRPDLHEQAFGIFAAVRSADLRSRLLLVTWQEVAACVGKPLQHFLGEKYGIFAK